MDSTLKKGDSNYGTLGVDSWILDLGLVVLQNVSLWSFNCGLRRGWGVKREK